MLAVLRKRWWWVFIVAPIGGFIFLTLEARVIDRVNLYVDAHANLATIKPLLVVIANATSPASFSRAVVWAVAFCIAAVLLLIAHAYWETRPAHSPKIAGGPFLTLHFPVPNLISSEIRSDYLLIKNIGERTALDVQVAALVE